MTTPDRELRLMETFVGLLSDHQKDFEGFVREMGRPAATSGLPAPVEPTPSMQAALGQAAAAHRIILVGPPLAAL